MLLHLCSIQPLRLYEQEGKNKQDAAGLRKTQYHCDTRPFFHPTFSVGKPTMALESLPSAATDNPYLARRQARIARNEAHLRSLGLQKTSKQYKTTRIKYKKPRVPRTPPARRSTRSKQRPDYMGVIVTPELSTKSPSPPPQDSLQVLWNPPPKVLETTTAIVPEAPPDSSRSTCINVNEIVNQYLGRRLEETGKAAVISASAGRTVRFNKYSGALAWSNCTYLWINLGGDNEFVDDTVTWYGGARMHGLTPVIQQLLSTSPVVLWVRQPIRNGFTPYVCFGRLEVRMWWM